MYIGLALLTNAEVHNFARKIVFDLNQEYGTGIENALLPQHISLKQSFPYEGKIEDIEKYLKTFCSNLKPLKIVLEKVEINLIGEETILGWIKVRDCGELKDVHTKLCKELKSEFNIEPLGFDGTMWKFHSTLTISKVKKNTIHQLHSEYHNKDVNIEYEAREIVMFCNLGDPTKTSDYFSLKIFDLS